MNIVYNEEIGVATRVDYHQYKQMWHQSHPAAWFSQKENKNVSLNENLKLDENKMDRTEEIREKFFTDYGIFKIYKDWNNKFILIL